MLSLSRSRSLFTSSRLLALALSHLSLFHFLHNTRVLTTHLTHTLVRVRVLLQFVC
jgi:hypothetical protein